MGNYKKTKFICTIGPSSWDPSVMKGMISHGMNCARVNGAFADRAEMSKVTRLVRDISNDVSLMIDTKGPEVRLNKFKKPIKLKAGQAISIGSSTGDKIYPANNLDVYKELSPGQQVAVGDGEVEMEVVKIKNGVMECLIKSGSELKPGKALNFLGAKYYDNTLTKKDLELIGAAKDLEWEFVSASFINDVDAVRQIKKVLEGSNLKLIAKIESQQGINNLDEILPEVYGIMIARGGLGVELGLEKVPAAQDEIMKKCIEAKKTVITATQFLESMIENPRPTRAEVDDVANCIEDRTDCVMLSGESSIGKYPVKAVEMLKKITLETEPRVAALDLNLEKVYDGLQEKSGIKTAVQDCVKNKPELTAVIALSNEGENARMLGKYGLHQPIFAFIPDEKSKNHLSIDKGVTNSFVFKNIDRNKTRTIKNIINFALEHNIVGKDADLFILSGYDNSKKGISFPKIAEAVNISEYI